MLKFRSSSATLGVCLLAVLAVLPTTTASADLIELLSGAKVEGTISKIDKAAKEVTLTRDVGGRPFSRVYPYGKIHAVTVGSKRYVLTPMTDDASPSGKQPVSGAGSTGSSSGEGRRSRAEVQALIEQDGTTPPDWFEATPLNYPKTLDLDWPEPAPQGWNNQKNVGQYLWDIINTNPGRWKEGVRFMHHLLSLHKDQPGLRDRIKATLGHMYRDFLQDDARAAYWWQEVGVHQAGGKFVHHGPTLATCYYRLGNKQMATELLMKLEKSSPQINLVKAWGDIGELRRATQLADSYARGSPTWAASIYVLAADACRTNGSYPQALEYYRKVLDAPATGQFAKRIEREQNRARASIEAIKLFELADVRRVPDGVYQASSLGYEDQVHVSVTVRSGRIEDVRVTQHREKQFYSSLTETSAQIVQKQGVKGVDATSGATITSEAIINATAKALAGAAK